MADKLITDAAVISALRGELDPVYDAQYAPLRVGLHRHPGQMALMSGTPSRGSIASGRGNAWLMDGGSSEFIIAEFEKPEGWTTASLVVSWVNAGAGSGNVRFNCPTASFDVGETASVVTANPTAMAAAGVQDVVVSTTITTLTLDTYNHVRVGRLGGDALDTLANDIGIIRVSLIRLT